jgi:hypothetical protein
MYCDCDGWKTGSPELRSFTVLAWTHGVKYTAPPFKFCPWCGKELAYNDAIQRAHELDENFRD